MITPPHYSLDHQAVKPRIEFIDTAKGICIIHRQIFHHNSWNAYDNKFDCIYYIQKLL